jgi:hypothetical protein
MNNSSKNFEFEIKQRFFESPNFSMFSDGEEIALARVTTKAAAEAYVRIVALDIVRDLCGAHIHDFNEIPSDDPVKVEFDRESFCIIRYGDVTAHIFNIERICPDCGCNPKDEPYCMEPTHCPACGHIFED